MSKGFTIDADSITAEKIDVSKDIAYGYEKEGEDYQTNPFLDVPNVLFIQNSKNRLKIAHSNKALWMKLSLNNNTNYPFKKLLYFDTENNEDTFLYKKVNGSLELLSYYKDGTYHSIEGLRDHSEQAFTHYFNINLEKGESSDFYIQRLGETKLFAKAYLVEPSYFSQKNTYDTLIYSTILGLSFAMLLINIFLLIFGVIKTKFQMYYIGFSLLNTVFILSFSGMFNRLNWAFLNEYRILFIVGTVVFLYEFVSKFLHNSWAQRKMRSLSYVFYSVLSFSILNHFILKEYFNFLTWKWVNFTIASMFLAIFALAIYEYFNKNKKASLFLLSWTPLFIGVAWWFLENYEVIELTDYTRYRLCIAIALEKVFYVIGMVIAIKNIEKSRTKIITEAREKKRYQRAVQALSHDLKNQLTVILMNAENLKDPMFTNDPISDSAKVYVNEIEERADKMNFLIQKIRDYEKSGTLIKEEVNLFALYEAIYDDLKVQFDDKGINFTFNGDKNINIETFPVVLQYNILHNFISNAIKFSPLGGVITFDVDIKDGRPIVRIVDEGKGMDANTVNAVFLGDDVKSEKGTKGEQGAGLGLILAKSYIDELEYDLDISSERNKGTVVELKF